jgi:hypothetical protein
LRAALAAGLAALAAILVVLCLRGLMPMLGILAPTTLAFMGACIGVLGVSDDDTTHAQRRFAVGATVFATLVLLLSCALLVRALAMPE